MFSPGPQATGPVFYSASTGPFDPSDPPYPIEMPSSDKEVEKLRSSIEVLQNSFRAIAMLQKRVSERLDVLEATVRGLQAEIDGPGDLPGTEVDRSSP